MRVLAYITFLTTLAVVLAGRRPYFASRPPAPRNHLESAIQEIQRMRLLPRRSVFVGTVPSIEVVNFPLGQNYNSQQRNTGLQNLLGLDIPPNVIAKLESRISSLY